MTTPSSFEELGLSITFSDPLIKTDRASLALDFNSSDISSYSHESRRVGGYIAAQVAFSSREEQMNDWIQNGIGRHIEVYNPNLVKVWEGFVEQVDIDSGEDKFTIGPLSAIGTRRSVTYSTIDYSVDPPILGARVTTATTDNDIAIAKYGIWHKIASINGATDTDAEQLRDQFVNDPTRAFPATTGGTSFASGRGFNVSLTLAGYWKWFSAYYYANSGSGSVALSTKIQDVITADVNGIFSTDFSKIASNSTDVKDSASGEQTAETILVDLNSRGDSSDNPYAIGCYNDRRIVYEQIPMDIVYQKRRGQQVEDNLGGLIRPWDVKPNEWLFRPDFLVGRHPPITSATLGTDPRAGLIETVKYSTPYGLSVNGIKLSNLDQVLAKRGIGGVG